VRARKLAPRIGHAPGLPAKLDVSPHEGPRSSRVAMTTRDHPQTTITAPHPTAADPIFTAERAAHRATKC
ncbi:MAG: hypothetical protein M3460_30960, partial [Actinomycetota bacterium]|nr:hypothetical protein [Actinomycetota bacterium]